MAKANSVSYSTVTLRGASLGFGGRQVLADFDLDLRPEITCLLGPSGAGKTTLLRAIAGLVRLNAGEVAGTRHVAWMGPDGGLMPGLRVIDNVTLGARLRGEKVDRTRAHALLTDVGLGDQAGSMPATLSSGMQQRVALARALYEDADVVLLDEPFARLDATMRAQLYRLTARMLAGRIVLWVTHDPMESLTIGGRILVAGGQPMRILSDLAVDPPAPRDPRDPNLDAIATTIFASLEAA